jgi:hypothetical protein
VDNSIVIVLSQYDPTTDNVTVAFMVDGLEYRWYEYPFLGNSYNFGASVAFITIAVIIIVTCPCWSSICALSVVCCCSFCCCCSLADCLLYCCCCKPSKPNKKVKLGIMDSKDIEETSISIVQEPTVKKVVSEEEPAIVENTVQSDVDPVKVKREDSLVEQTVSDLDDSERKFF